MWQAGATFRGILASLTTTPAQRFDGEPNAGEVAVGRSADLVVLNGDPSINVRALASVRYTLRGGEIIYRRGSKSMTAVEDERRPSGQSEFGTLLRQYRIAAGLSQEALAERARMSTNGIGALERGYRRTPQRETLALLVSALELDDERREEFEAAAQSRLGRAPASRLCRWRSQALSDERRNSASLHSWFAITV